PPVDKQLMHILAAGAVVADGDPRRNHGGGQVCPQCHLRVQQGVEAPTPQSAAQLPIPARPRFLVEHAELDAGQVAHQLVFDLADYPGDVNAGLLLLQAQHDRDNMRDVADGGDAEEADRVQQAVFQYGLGTRGWRQGGYRCYTARILTKYVRW